MNDFVLNLIYFLVAYALVFVVYAFIVNRKKKTYTDAKKLTEVDYIVNKFDLDKRKIKYNKLKWILNFINPFIIALTFIVVTNIKSLVLGIVIGFAIMLLLIYSVYEIVGRILKKRGEKDV